MSLRPEYEQIEFEWDGAAVRIASTCACVRSSVLDAEKTEAGARAAISNEAS
jgi:hypothetical protein